MPSTSVEVPRTSCATTEKAPAGVARPRALDKGVEGQDAQALRHGADLPDLGIGEVARCGRACRNVRETDGIVAADVRHDMSPLPPAPRPRAGRMAEDVTVCWAGRI
ncbi:hypothetical protein GCM10008026_13980 [Chelatococcus composti]|nr:hypothetical protein GCM10008026_13980 [Chelatococcus composti]